MCMTKLLYLNVVSFKEAPLIPVGVLFIDVMFFNFPTITVCRREAVEWSLSSR